MIVTGCRIGNGAWGMGHGGASATGGFPEAGDWRHGATATVKSATSNCSFLALSEGIFP